MGYKDPYEQFKAQIKWRQNRIDEINKIKMTSGCIQCGYNKHPVALQFHHRDPKTKSNGSIHQMLSKNVSMKKILTEIEKCDVLCGNCHAILHDDERPMILQNVKHGTYNSYKYYKCRCEQCVNNYKIMRHEKYLRTGT